jgi:hypothetical protein
MAMVGVGNEHSLVHGNLLTALISRLRGNRCEFPPDTRPSKPA